MGAVEEIFVEAISNPFKAQEAAREMALRSDLTPDEIKILRGILQPWWDTEKDAVLLYDHIVSLGAIAGMGSPAHRLVVHIAVLCARTVLPNVREQDRTESTNLLDTLAAWARGEAPGANLNAIRDRASTLWSDAALEAAVLENNNDGDVRKKISILANMAGSAAAAVFCAARATDAIAVLGNRNVCSPHAVAAVAGHAHALNPSQGDGWEEARDRRLSERADLIRNEIPVCPIGVP